MQKYNIILVSLMLFFFACTGDEIPKGVLAQDTMIGLLTQIHIADGSMYNTMQVPDSLYKYGLNKYDIVLKSFHTDSNQLKKSMRYYSQHPDILEKMYDKIQVNLKQKSDSLNKVNQAQIAIDNKRRTDSIAKLPKQQQKHPAVVVPQTPPPGKQAPHFTNHRYLPPKPNGNPVK